MRTETIGRRADGLRGIGRVAAVGVTAIALAAAGAVPALGRPYDPAPWSSPQGLGRSSGEAIGVAVSPNGRRAVLVGSVDTAGTVNRPVQAFTWSSTGWRRQSLLNENGTIDDIDVALAKDGRRAVALWEGVANEGVPDLLVAGRTSSGWTAAQWVGSGRATMRMTPTGSRALVVFYNVDNEDGYDRSVSATWWDGTTWSVPVALPTTDTGDLDWSHKPLVALADDGSTAAAAWVQAGGVRASWWSGGTWSAPYPVAPAARGLAMGMTPDGTGATLITGTPSGSNLAVQRWSLGPAGVTGPVEMGVIGPFSPSDWYKLKTSANRDASAVVATYPSGGGPQVAMWPPGATTPVISSFAGTGGVSATMPPKGSAAGLVVRPTWADGKGRYRIAIWDGDSWRTVGKPLACADPTTPPVLALSARGTTKVLAWACGQLYVTRTAGS